MQLDRSNFKNQEKQLKRYNYEQQKLEMILNHIKQCISYEELRSNPISIMYGFEPLKYNLNGYYSFIFQKMVGLLDWFFQ